MGQRGENEVSAFWAWDVIPQNTASNGYDAMVGSVSPNPCQRSVVTVSDLGLDVITQPRTASLPQRHTLSLGTMSHTLLQVQPQFAPSSGLSQMTTVPTPENWIAVPVPICFGEHVPTSVLGASSPSAVLSVSGARSNERQATEPLMTPPHIGVSAPR